MYSTSQSTSVAVPVTTTQGGIGAIGGFNFGGNPNVSQLFGNPTTLAIVGVTIVLGLFFWSRKR